MAQHPVARELADFITSVRFEDIPADVRDLAKMLVASTLASAADGVELPAVAAVRDGSQEIAPDGAITVWFRGATSQPAYGARLNAMSSDAAAADDSDLRFGTHAGTPAVAAALALAEAHGVSGAEIVRAVALGCEAAARLGTAVGDPLLRKGFHMSVLAAFAAAASAAAVLGSSAEEMHVTLSLTAATAAGLGCGSNSDLRPYQAGMAAGSGVSAAIAAKAGYRVRDAFGPDHGFFEAFGEGRETRLYLGPRWTFADTLAFKLWGGAFLFAAVAEAAADAASRAGVPAGEIAELMISGKAFAGSEAIVPTDRVEALGSLAYAAAASVAAGGLGWTHLADAAIHDPAIQRLVRRVVIDESPGGEQEWRYGATVTVVTDAGSRVQSRVDYPLGTVRRGVSWPDLDSKARTLLPRAGLAVARIEALLTALHELDSLPSVQTLTSSLRAKSS